MRRCSTPKDGYQGDNHGANKKADQLPACACFVQPNVQTYHVYTTELSYIKAGPGQDGRHVDLIWPLWNLFDYTPEGRGTDWYPELKYD